MHYNNDRRGGHISILNMINRQRCNQHKYAKLFFPLLLSLFLTLGLADFSKCQEPDTLIQRLVEEISDSLYTNSIQRLQDFHTRYELSDSIGPAGQWIYDQFIEIGYTDVEFDSFTWDPHHSDTSIVSRNILATKPGNTENDSLIILGGHYDSVQDIGSWNDPNAYAPGANDNASGVAGVLEIARLLEPFSFEKTIVFACFAGEEVGYGGSSHYSWELNQLGIPFRFALILDMIGYQANPYMYPVIIDAEMSYLDDALRTAQMAWTYSNWLTPYLTFGIFHSDQWILGMRGPAILIIEEVGYLDPIFHTAWDVIDSLSIPYATEILRMALASIVDVANYVTVGIKTSDRKGLVKIPKAFALSQNYPNPFNPSTTIDYSIPEGEAEQVQLLIYDLRGRLIRSLINEEKSPGSYSVHWDGRSNEGREVGSGVYLYRIEAGEFISTKKMIITR